MSERKTKNRVSKLNQRDTRFVIVWNRIGGLKESEILIGCWLLLGGDTVFESSQILQTEHTILGFSPYEIELIRRADKFDSIFVPQNEAQFQGEGPHYEG